MQQLANAISLFIRRMEDLDLRQDAMSIICFEQACSWLDQETALRYATYCELGKSQGIVESMGKPCRLFTVRSHYLRSTVTLNSATTSQLERAETRIKRRQSCRTTKRNPLQYMYSWLQTSSPFC